MLPVAETPTNTPCTSSPEDRSAGILPGLRSSSWWSMETGGWKARMVCGVAACFEAGEQHAKGSESGMTAVMVQVSDMDPKGEEP